MSQDRHSSMGIHGQVVGAKGIHRLSLLRSTQKKGVLILGVLVIGAAIVIGLRVAKANALAETAREQSTRYVTVITPKPAAGESELRLPGTLQGIIEAPIYARTTGYLSRWYKDIGDTVKQGDLLAVIDTPEVAQQLNEAKSNLQLAQATFDRWSALQKRDAVSQQEFEEKRNTLATATATVKRLEDQLGHSRIVAPFSGVVTRRNIDIGNLIDAGSATKILFSLAKTDPLRVYVYVPQNYANQIKAGNKATVTLREMPGQSFEATIVRTAGAIDTTTRTLQVEVNLPNKEGKLLPGAYAQVAINAKGGEANSLRVPSNTLLFRAEGLRVAVVDANGKVHLQPVVIGRELGVEIELSSGITANDQLIINPSDALNEGDIVSVVADKAAANNANKDAPSTDKPSTDKPNKGAAS